MIVLGDLTGFKNLSGLNQDFKSPNHQINIEMVIIITRFKIPCKVLFFIILQFCENRKQFPLWHRVS